MPDALHFLVLTVAGWVNRPQDDQLAYLREEHRGLRASWPGGSVGPGTCRCAAASAPPRRRHVCHDHWPARAGGPGRNLRRIDRRCPAPAALPALVPRSTRHKPTATTSYALMAESRFPKPIRIGSLAVRRVEQEVFDFIASRPRGGSERTAA